jgi:hypothetical protein
MNECDYRQVLDWWLNLLHTLIQHVTTLYSSLLHTHWCPQSCLHCDRLLAASNSRCSSSGFPNCPRPQLPASNSNSSQWLNPSSSLTASESQSQSYFTTGDLMPVRLSWWQAPWDSQHSKFIFHLNTCGYSPYVTSSLMREWDCCLQLLLVLTSAVTFRSESRGTHDHILLSQI